MYSHLHILFIIRTAMILEIQMYMYRSQAWGEKEIWPKYIPGAVLDHLPASGKYPLKF